jgi:hypothetical protein
MSWVSRPAVLAEFIPGPASGVENPNPGRDGITRWKASAGSPPWERDPTAGR